ncbi:hypothetical protein K2Z84_27290 [Candidatus Binatia bacterium]|nr:hypothetical protein [Candidatus Binatia bacterium]
MTERLPVAIGVVLTLAIVALYVEFQRYAGPLWRDEVNSVNLAHLPSLYEVYANSHLDSFPTAWVLLLSSWVGAGLGETDASLRALGLVVGLATLGTWWWTGRRLGLRAPLLTLLLLGLNPTWVIYGTQVRGYGLGVLGISWALGATFSFVRRPALATALIAQAAAILAVQSYFGNCFLVAAICAAGAAVALVRGSIRLAAAVVGIGAVAAMSMSVNLFSVAYAAGLSSIEQGTYSLAWYAEVFWNALGPELPVLQGAWAIAALGAIAGIASSLAAAPSDDTDADDARARALYVAVAAATGLAGYAAYVGYISVRTQVWYYLSLMSVVAFACDVGSELLARRFARGVPLRAAAAALFACIVVSGVAPQVRMRMTNLDAIAVTLAREAKPDDLVVVFPWYCGISFARYYRGAAPWITLPDFERHAYHEHALVAEKMKGRESAVATELTRVEQTLRSGHRVWIAGPLVAPEPGQPPRPLPRPDEPQRAPYYLENWEQQLGALLRTHARDVWNVPLPELGPVNRWEGLPLLVAEGWR